MKILMYGDFNFGGGPYDGATTKTRNIYKCLQSRYGSIEVFNIEGWRKHPIKKYIELKRKIKEIDCVVFIPGAKNGTLFALKFFTKAKKRKNLRLYYFVAGSLIKKYLDENKTFIKYVKELDGVFCETHGLMNELATLGITNTYFSPTFDLRGDAKYVSHWSLNSEILKLCTFSRVTKKKGIDIACKAINYINRLNNKITIKYDIYGKLDDNFKDELNQYIQDSNGLINYFGILDDSKVIDTLSNYDAMIFATYFEGECLPATVIESLKASTPVIISNWKYNREIIEDNVNGFVFGNNVDDLVKTILEKCVDKTKLDSLRLNCFNKSKAYNHKNCLADLYNFLDEE